MKSKNIIWILIIVILIGLFLLVLSRLGLIQQKRDPSDLRYSQTLSSTCVDESSQKHDKILS